MRDRKDTLVSKIQLFRLKLTNIEPKASILQITYKLKFKNYFTP